MNNRLNQFFDRIEHLASRIEPLLPKTGTTDWSATAYHWHGSGYLEAIRHPDTIGLDDLLHNERAKSLLTRNTVKFLEGKPANHALLWGSRGTGKSSLVKALLNEYSPEGLRIIEVEPKDLVNLSQVVEPLFQRREKYIIFCDDLSFESNDSSYKALKAALDGSIATTPDNLLIYATSNRRHLIPEYMSENQEARVIDGELHHSENTEEKVSLSERFGLWLSFYPFGQDEYLEIVYHWLVKQNIPIGEREEMERAAIQFATQRGSRSGRVAKQFANEWADA